MQIHFLSLNFFNNLKVLETTTTSTKLNEQQHPHSNLHDTSSNITEMPQSAAILEKLKRFEESNNDTKTTNQNKQSSAYLPIYSHQQTSTNPDTRLNDKTSDKDERQMAAKGLVNENRVCKYLFKSSKK